MEKNSRTFKTPDSQMRSPNLKSPVFVKNQNPFGIMKETPDFEVS